MEPYRRCTFSRLKPKGRFALTAVPSSKTLLRLIGPLILLIFLMRVDIGTLVAAFTNVHPGLFLAAALLTIPSLLIKGARWQQLLRVLKIERGLVECTGMYATGMALGTFTPGQLGEFSKVWQMAETGHGYLRALLASLVDRGLDVLVLMGFGLSGLFWYSGSAPVRVGISLPLLAGLLLALSLALIFWIWRTPAGLQSWWQQGVTLWRELSNRRRLAWVLLATLSYILIQYGGVYLCVVALGAPIPFPYMVFVYSISALVASLPVTVAGIGTRDALFFYFFSQVGLPTETCLVLSSLVLGLKVANGLLLSLLAWLIERRLATEGNVSNRHS